MLNIHKIKDYCSVSKTITSKGVYFQPKGMISLLYKCIQLREKKTTNMIGYSCLTFQPELSFKQKRENS